MTLHRQFIERGYYVYPLVATKMLFGENGLKAADSQRGDSMLLRELTGADALLYVTITEWANTGVFAPSVRVAAE